jgi:hypothetical protein
MRMPQALRRIVVYALFGCVLAAVGVSPAAASFDSPHARVGQPAHVMNKKQRKLCREAKPVRRSVIKKYGKQEPGRDICVQGNRDGSTPSVPKLSGYLAVLHRKLTPPVAKSTSAQPSSAGAAGSGGVASSTLEAIAQCESGGNPTTDTGNGFYGKYQFTLSTWQSVGGTGNPAQASEAEQDRRAAALYAQSGPAPWPVCGR